MLKAFLRAPGPHEVSFWEAYFASQSFEYLVRSFPVDPLRPLFTEYCRDGARVLEGGCGLGQYLPPLAELGARTVGLDFGVDMLREVRRRVPGTPLVAGDVTRLPVADASFDVYYSGGVVEHFEAGPHPPLREAWRILKPGGTFLVSVPYENWIRRVTGTWASSELGVAQRVDRERKTPPPAGHSFFQYFYRPSEFRARLQDAGFEVVREQPYSMWRGMNDLALCRRLEARVLGRVSSPSPPTNAATTPAAVAGDGQRREQLKRLVFAEDRSMPVLGMFVSLGCEAAANMRMYVCRRP